MPSKDALTRGILGAAIGAVLSQVFSYCNFAEVIPVAILQYTAIIGFILLAITVFLELAGKRRN